MMFWSWRCPQNRMSTLVKAIGFVIPALHRSRKRKTVRDGERAFVKRRHKKISHYEKWIGDKQ